MEMLRDALGAFDRLVHSVPSASAYDFPFIRDAWFWLPIIVPLYLVLVFGGPLFMKNREALECKPILALWNLSLSLLSVVMFYSTFTRVGAETVNAGSDWLYYLITLPEPYDARVWNGPHMFWMWVFGLSKVFELFDTALLVVRKRKVGLLHWYHHTTVLVFTWFCMNVVASPGFVFGIMNAFVHSIMYFYYFLTSLGYRPWWGNAVTLIQLSQMAVGVGVSVLWTYFYLFTERECPLKVPVHAWVVTTCVAIYGSYFLLFLDFYRRRLASQRAAAEAKKKGEKKRS